MKYLPLRFFACPISSFNGKNFNLSLKSSKVEFWNILPFAKAKLYHKVVIFGSKSYNLSTTVKYINKKKAKYVVKIHVGNYLDIWCRCFRLINSFIFVMMNSELSLEYFIGFCCYGWISLSFHSDYKRRYIIIYWCEIFLYLQDLVCW